MEKSTKPRNHNKAPKKTGKRKKRSKKWLWILFLTAATGTFCAIILYGFIIINGDRLLKENIDKLEMPEASIIYDKDGKEASKLDGQNRESVTYAELPEMIKIAFIATEDKRFEEHDGIDYWGIARALIKDILERRAAEGGSTITQQLAKNLFLNNDKTIFRKATEMSIATALEGQYSKDRILEMYLNRIYFGKSAYGIKAAAKTYFGKDNLEDLELWEIANLAAIPKSPTYYNPIDYPDRSKLRRDTVLLLMADQGKITVEQKLQAQAQPIKTSTRNLNLKYPSYIDMVLKEASEVSGISEEKLYRNGYKIYTSLDVDAQSALEQAYDNPELFPKDGPEQIVQSSMVILDNQTGGIAAVIGGRDYVRKGYNRALEKRQPGSAFKPIAVYAPAIESGDWNPSSMLDDTKQSFGKYSPRNLSGKYSGKMSMTDAVRSSVNIPAVWLLNEIGMKTGFEFAKSLGIEMDNEDRNLTIALGGLTRGASPLEMARAYSAFADHGTLHTTHTITSIKDKDNKEIYTFKPKDKQVMSEQTAWYTTELLKSVVSGGSGTKARVKNHEVAGKTGTTQSGIQGVSGSRDVWFVGYTAQYTASVWMGFAETNKEHILEVSSSKAATLFSQVMNKALEGSKPTTLKKPSGVVDVPPVKTSIAPVQDLTAAYIDDSVQIQINWTAVGDNLNYQLFRKSSVEPYELLLTTAVTSVQDFNITGGEAYEYYVVALDSELELESEASNIVNVLTPVIEGGEPGIEPGFDSGNEDESQLDDESQIEDESELDDEPITDPESESETDSIVTSPEDNTMTDNLLPVLP